MSRPHHWADGPAAAPAPKGAAGPTTLTWPWGAPPPQQPCSGWWGEGQQGSWWQQHSRQQQEQQCDGIPQGSHSKEDGGQTEPSEPSAAATAINTGRQAWGGGRGQQGGWLQVQQLSGLQKVTWQVGRRPGTAAHQAPRWSCPGLPSHGQASMFGTLPPGPAPHLWLCRGVATREQGWGEAN